MNTRRQAHMARWISVGIAAATLAACGGGGSTKSGSSVEIVVSAPVSTSPWIAQSERNGAELAAAQLNAKGGVKYAGSKHQVVIKVLDNGGSPQQSAANAREAVSEHAAALIIDGVGAAAVSDVTKPASLPTFVVFDGGDSILDPINRPTMFRIAPADKDMTMRLADYLAASHPNMGILVDDTSFGADGLSSLTTAFQRDDIAVPYHATVPSTVSDVSTQVLAARHAGVTSLVVWAGAPIVAATIQAARSSGWQVPIWAGPSGEDPLVRQRLADHMQWLAHVGFVSFRITAEIGAAPFAAYRKAYVSKFGADKVGVKQGGKDVIQPPDWSMFSYDAVNLVAASLTRAGALGPALLSVLSNNEVITGANGDERGFSPSNHSAVSPDDMYFAVFNGFEFAPVTDDLLSKGLPAVPQT